ncbi:MAG TPA: hypothetical protein VFQ35_00065, partial [Polyangiaceae bacterium]|nr:hypothetical protein [Polyangiaceae bacterium]
MASNQRARAVIRCGRFTDDGSRDSSMKLTGASVAEEFCNELCQDRHTPAFGDAARVEPFGL